MRTRWTSLLTALVVASAACGGGSQSIEAFCDVGDRLEAEGQFLDLPPNQARETIPRVRAIFEDGIAAAPGDVKPSYEIVVDALIPLLDVFEDSDFGAGDVDQAALQAAFDGFGAPEVAEASDFVEAWIEEHCAA